MHISSFRTNDASGPNRHRARDSFGYVLWDTTLTGDFSLCRPTRALSRETEFHGNTQHDRLALYLQPLDVSGVHLSEG